MDYLIIFIATASGLYFHWWLYVRIKRWADRDLALSMAGSDPQKRDFMLQQLTRARAERIKRGELEDWLQRAAANYPD